MGFPFVWGVQINIFKIEIPPPPFFFLKNLSNIHGFVYYKLFKLKNFSVSENVDRGKSGQRIFSAWLLAKQFVKLNFSFALSVTWFIYQTDRETKLSGGIYLQSIFGREYFG